MLLRLRVQSLTAFKNFLGALKKSHEIEKNRLRWPFFGNFLKNRRFKKNEKRSIFFQKKFLDLFLKKFLKINKKFKKSKSYVIRKEMF